MRARRDAHTGTAGTAGVALVRALAPTWLRRPPPVPLEGEVADFVDGLFEGLDRSRIWDCHAHVMGAGEGDTGCTVSARAVDRISGDVVQPLKSEYNGRGLANVSIDERKVDA